MQQTVRSGIGHQGSTLLTSSRCSGVELSVALAGSAGPLEEAEERARGAAVPFGTLLEVDGAEPLLEFV